MSERDSSLRNNFARIADGIRAKIQSLNESLGQAAEAGIWVDLDVLDTTDIGDRVGRSTLSATIRMDV